MRNSIEIHNDPLSSFLEKGEFARRYKKSDFSVGLLSFSKNEGISFIQVDEEQVIRISPDEYNAFNTRKTKKRSTLHSHDYYELLYIVDGEMNEEFEDEVLTLKQGEATLLNKNIIHGEQLGDSSFSAIYLCLSDFSAERLLQYYKPDDSSIVLDFFSRQLHSPSANKGEYCLFTLKSKTDSNEIIQQLVNQIVIELNNKESGFQFICLGYLRKIINILDSQYDYNHHNVYKLCSGGKITIEKIGLYVGEYMGNISKHKLAAILGYNADYLCKLVKQNYGVSYNRYCLDIKIQNAANLLANTGLSVTSICEKLGFSNRSYFYRLFESKYKVKPMQYRKMKKQN